MKPTRILLADDHAPMLEIMQAILEPSFETVGTAADGIELVAAALLLKPDLIVLDITMPELSGIRAAEQIKTHFPNMKLVFVTMHSQRAYLEAALRTGAGGYVLKASLREDLMRAIGAVLQGEVFVSAGVG